jgi:hypothetical protein
MTRLLNKLFQTNSALVPMLFMYGKLKGKESFCEQSIRLLEELPA